MWKRPYSLVCYLLIKKSLHKNLNKCSTLIRSHLCPAALCGCSSSSLYPPTLPHSSTLSETCVVCLKMIKDNVNTREIYLNKFSTTSESEVPDYHIIRNNTFQKQNLMLLFRQTVRRMTGKMWSSAPRKRNWSIHNILFQFVNSFGASHKLITL